MSELARVVRTRFSALIKHEPMPGVTYPEVLMVDAPLARRWRVVALGVGGCMLGIISFFVFTRALIMFVVWLGWVAAGSPGTLQVYGTAAAAYELPIGMLATNLGLALLIPISVGLVLFVPRFRPHWLHSVQPGFRWRFMLAAVLVGLVVLGGVWAVSRIGQPWVFAPEQQWGWFLLIVLLTSPLQAAAEEYFFRGYLIQALHTTSSSSPWFGVVASAAVFALFHGTQNLPLFLYRFAFGVLAGVLVVKTGGLEAGIAAHVVNNVVAYGYAVLSGTVVATHAVTEIGWLELAWTLAGFGAFAAVTIWIARRMRVATTTPGVRFGGPAEV
ncbi:MAG TPA: CPBP family intramembrane glutamic endopeptidase [Propionicimonas sp.]|nr:CPBP family intramembrane glutamic endopeptidase [Propionicimonas sp.]